MDLKEKNCLVIGAGKSGIAAARLLARNGAKVVVNDKAELDHLEFHEAENITLRGGGHNDDIFKNQDLIVLSPGVPANVKPLSDLLAQAEVEGAEIISEIELASRYVKAPIIAIGGTNGKSTTTTLLANMLELGGKKVFSGGNLGTPFCQHVLNGEEADIIALEVSSFQLEGIKTFRPFISILLNITSDHLDRYKSMEEYIDAKNKIFMNQCSGDYAVVNDEDERVKQLTSEITARIIPFGVNKQHKGGVYMSNNCLTSEMEGHKVMLDGELLKNMGRHNLENVMAAVAAAILCDVSPQSISQAIEGFVGLPHRMEYVADVCGISFYDDSKATNVGALLRSLETVEQKVILIAGGKDKGGSYDCLKGIIRDKVNGLVLIGEAARGMREALGSKLKTFMADNMEEAVEHAWHLASEGDMILLSPACSSFDMFSNYSERGDAFKEAARSLVARIEDNKKESVVAR